MTPLMRKMSLILSALLSKVNMTPKMLGETMVAKSSIMATPDSASDFSEDVTISMTIPLAAGAAALVNGKMAAAAATSDNVSLMAFERKQNKSE